MADAGATAARAIARARTGRQLRAAAGLTLTELSEAYRLLGDIPLFSSRTKKGSQLVLDKVRGEIESLYKRIGDMDVPPPGAVGTQLRNALQKAWVEIAGLRAETDSFAGWSGADILAQAIVEAPATFLAGVNTAVKGAGDTASGLLGSALKGLWPVLLILAIVVVAAGAARKRGYA
jgi:hypothetical protein